jgi:peptide/nickel transport system permease protein
MTEGRAGIGALGAAGTAASSAPGFAKRLLCRPTAVVCVAYLTAIAVIAIAAPLLVPSIGGQHAGDLLAARQGPSSHHLLGTDALGRDVLDRLLVGTRVTMVGVLQALLVALFLGVPFGLAAGFFGGWIDRAVVWTADLTFSVPAIVIIIVVLSVFTQSMSAAMVTLGVLTAPGVMRVVRSAVLPVREELYIAAAHVSGLSRRYIVTRHVLPRISGVVIVQASYVAASALLTQTGLAFLSLVVAAPAPSWGGMVADGANVIVLDSWLIWPPGIAIALTIVALGLLGDSVRDASVEGWAGRAPRRRPRPHRQGSVPTRAVTLPRTTAHRLLAIERLSVALPTPSGSLTVVDDVWLDIEKGEAVGLVGESGCGKTMTALAILRLLPGNGTIEGGRVLFDGRELTSLSEGQMRRLRGREIGFVSQEPMIGLNPAFRVGWQLAEAVRRHHNLSRKVTGGRVLELLEQVRFADPTAISRCYPHELSGGMAQRVAIARALAGEPRLLIADEPTTALDVTIQAEILQLLRDLQADRNMAMLIVTHDWGVVADICTRAVVMYAGQVVERSELVQMFRSPAHPYTAALLASNPHNADAAENLPTIPGSVPALDSWPAGCRFQPRCSYATAACGQPIPITRLPTQRETRCVHHDRVSVT